MCWRCAWHEVYECCCNDTAHNLDCPEMNLGQSCPDFTPIQVQTSGLNK
nr:MAG TPA: hypothetical protein [Caudoviricetes sp.]